MVCLISCVCYVGKKKENYKCNSLRVVPPGIEPGTQGFSVLCSTN